jgi:ABC-type phosphate/phosphonate transport system ATPase subunit
MEKYKVAAMIGPSGAGKSTLLRALSGSIPNSN